MSAWRLWPLKPTNNTTIFECQDSLKASSLQTTMQSEKGSMTSTWTAALTHRTESYLSAHS